MKFFLNLFLLAAMIASSGCATTLSTQEGWSVTTAKVTDVTKFENGSYGYTITYKASKSTAINSEGNPIKGPISKHQFAYQRQPVEGQRIKIQYKQEEPIIYEALQEIQFID